MYQKRTRVLKKSLSARSAVQKRPERRPKHYENGISPSNGGTKSARRSIQHAGAFSDVRPFGVPGGLADGRMREDL